MQTEFLFTLPKGYVDEQGSLHKDGVMRLATASDEILPMKDPRVQENPAYLMVLLLSRVVTRLGELDSVSPLVIENLFSADLMYLQELYRRINEVGTTRRSVTCPNCGQTFEVGLYDSYRG